MSALTKTKQKDSTNNSKGQVTKLGGTRVGTLSDLRAGSGKGRSERSQHGKRLRDGQ